jgi:hypothetical protein
VLSSDMQSEPAANGTRSHSSRRVGLWLFAAFQFFYLLTSTGRVRTPDEYNTLYTTESLVLRGSTAVPQAVQLHNFYGRYDVHGQPRAAYTPGQALLCTPWYALGQYLLARLPGVPADDTDLVVAFSSCLSSATFSALTVAFFFSLLVGIGTPSRPSLFAAAMVGLGTPIFAYSGWLFSEPLSAAVFVGVALLLFGHGHEPTAVRTASIAGLVLGLATIVRPTNGLAIPAFAVAVLVRDGKAALRAAFFLCATSAIGVVALLAHNALLFGGPFEFGYPAAAEGAKRLNTFDTPLVTGLYGFLLSPGKSMFVFAPPLILALAGLRRLWNSGRLCNVSTFGGCRAARVVLETAIQEYGSVLHEPPQESVEERLEESAAQRRSHYSGQALFPHRRSRQLVPPARLRAALLGNGISAAPAGEKQHRAAHVPQARRRIRGADQEAALRGRFTIAGARVQLREESKTDRTQTALPFPMTPAINVAHFRNELQQILHILSARH